MKDTLDDIIADCERRLQEGPTWADKDWHRISETGMVGLNNEQRAANRERMINRWRNMVATFLEYAKHQKKVEGK